MSKNQAKATNVNNEKFRENEEQIKNIKYELSIVINSGDANEIIRLGEKLKILLKEQEYLIENDRDRAREEYKESIKGQLTEAVALSSADEIIELGDDLMSLHKKIKKKNATNIQEDMVGKFQKVVSSKIDEKNIEIGDGEVEAISEAEGTDNEDNEAKDVVISSVMENETRADDLIDINKERVEIDMDEIELTLFDGRKKKFKVSDLSEDKIKVFVSHWLDKPTEDDLPAFMRLIRNYPELKSLADDIDHWKTYIEAKR